MRQTEYAENFPATHRLTGIAAIALAALAATSWQSGTAQEVDDPEESPIPEFRIELIVFEYVEGINGRPEDWAYIDTGRAAVAESTPPPVGTLFPDGDPDGDGSPDSNGATRVVEFLGDVPPDNPVPEQTFQVLDASEYELTDAFSRLRATPDVRPILHTAWRQPVFGPDDAGTLNLTSIARPPRRLGGSVSVFLSRYLHLTLDLALAEQPQANTNGLGFGEAVVYRLAERRNKMRSDELHFFDHPRFGALARITRVPDAGDDPEAGASLGSVSR